MSGADDDGGANAAADAVGGHSAVHANQIGLVELLPTIPVRRLGIGSHSMHLKKWQIDEDKRNRM